MQSVLEARDVTFSYARTPAVKNISFTVQAGDYIGVIGPNGGGKTTLLKLLLGLEKGHGTVRLFGQEINQFSAWEKVGYLAQKSPAAQALFPISVAEVVRMGLCAHMNATQEEAAVQAALCQTHTQNLSSRAFADLSAGQQQRALLARALVSGPELLILDEPSTALDAASREHFFNLLARLNKEQNVTILLITHDTGEVGRHISKFMYVDTELKFYGTREAFCSSPRVAALLGPFAQHTIDHLHHEGHCPLGCAREGKEHA